MVFCPVTAPSTGDFSEPSHTPFHIFHYPQASDPSSHCQSHSLRLPPPDCQALYLSRFTLWPVADYATRTDLAKIQMVVAPYCLEKASVPTERSPRSLVWHRRVRQTPSSWHPASAGSSPGKPAPHPLSPPRLFPSSRDATCLHVQLFSLSWSRRGAFLSGSAKHLAVLKSLLKMISSMPPNNDPLQMYSS